MVLPAANHKYTPRSIIKGQTPHMAWLGVKSKILMNTLNRIIQTCLIHTEPASYRFIWTVGSVLNFGHILFKLRLFMRTYQKLVPPASISEPILKKSC